MSPLIRAGARNARKDPHGSVCGTIRCRGVALSSCKCTRGSSLGLQGGCLQMNAQVEYQQRKPTEQEADLTSQSEMCG